MINNKFCFLKEALPRKILLLGYKPLNIEEANTIRISKASVSYFTLSFNNIKIINVDGKLMFFRECMKHDPFPVFFQKLLDEFCVIAKQGMRLENFEQTPPFRTKYEASEILSFRDYIAKCVSQKEFYKQVRGGNVALKKANFAPWKGRLVVEDKLALEIGFLPWKEKNIELMSYFYSFIKSSITNYQFHDFVSGGGFETYFASRQLASYELAKLLGMQRLITSSELVCLDIEGEKHFGVLSNRAPGKRGLDCKEYLTPQMQRELTNLKVIDTLSYQIDHFANNYNVIYDERNKPISVCAFDNDANRTFWISPSVRFKANHNCSELISKAGEYAYPYLDKNVAKTLMGIDYHLLYSTMSKYLNQLQLWALRKRFEKLQGALRKRQSHDKGFLLDDDEWNKTTIEEELSGRYGVTYSVQYVHRIDRRDGVFESNIR